MLSETSLKQISYIFCGDTEGYYVYKTGGKLVDFFNTYYRVGDVYRVFHLDGLMYMTS